MHHVVYTKILGKCLCLKVTTVYVSTFVQCFYYAYAGVKNEMKWIPFCIENIVLCTLSFYSYTFLSNLHEEEYICSWFPLAPYCIIIYLCLSYPIYLLLALCSMFPPILFWAMFCVTLPLQYNMSLMPKVLNIDAGWEWDESVPSIDLCWLSTTGTIMLVKKKKN